MLLIKDRFQGVFLCFVLALPAYFLGKEFEIIGGPVLPFYLVCYYQNLFAKKMS